ncbi:MAG: hypothetical protein OXD40_10950, partial [bacterium]|nr:hypothetical protein [bacterium]
AASRDVDPGDSGAWRSEVGSALGSARELLGMAEAPELAGLGARADALLAGDDRVFARQATRDHAETWEARWQDLERRADAAGLSVHDHGSAAGAIDRARRILEDPALPESHRERISGVIEAFEARSEARRQAEMWLAAWEERKPSDTVGAEAMIGDARRLVADSALPSTWKSRLDLAIARHDRLVEVASPSAAETTAPAVETTDPAVDDAMPIEPVTPGRREGATVPVRPDVGEDENERERRRERAREAANRARQQAEAAHRQLESWEAHLAQGKLGRVIAHADEVARDPALAVPGRHRLEDAVRLARRRLDAHGAYGDWQAACRSHSDAATAQRRHVLDHPGHADLVTSARRLSEDPALSGTARRAVTAWLSQAADMADARAAFLERYASLQRLMTEAQARAENPLDLPETRDVVSWLRENLESAGATETERQAMRDVVATWDARQAERRRRDRGISWRV